MCIQCLQLEVLLLMLLYWSKRTPSSRLFLVGLASAGSQSQSRSRVSRSGARTHVNSRTKSLFILFVISIHISITLPIITAHFLASSLRSLRPSHLLSTFLRPPSLDTTAQGSGRPLTFTFVLLPSLGRNKIYTSDNYLVALRLSTMRKSRLECTRSRLSCRSRRYHYCVQGLVLQSEQS
jgi:hypothetical protein